jgi:hypothetical protein
MQMGEEREDEGRNYLFSADGTFRQQKSLSSDAMGPEFRYQLNGDVMKMSPVFLGEMQVISVEPEAFVLKWFGELHFVRGRCP